jgi:hypothetical protein
MVPFYQTTQCNTQKQRSVVATGVVIPPVPLVCSAFRERVLITTWSLLQRGTTSSSNFANLSSSRLSLNNFGNFGFPKQVTDSCFVGIIVIRKQVTDSCFVAIIVTPSGCEGSDPTTVAT